MVLLLVVVNAVAQDEHKNEVGLLLGGIRTSGPSATGATPGAIDINTGLSFQATYARRLIDRSGAAVYFEVPFVATPSTDVKALLPQVPINYASLFITPGVRVKLAPAAPVAPWVALGGGFARFTSSSTRTDGLPNMALRDTNTGALQFGGGVDINRGLRVLFPITFRGEVRDFYSGTPELGTPLSQDRQHNVVFSGGFVIHF
jgi:hypothetical protein